MGEVRLYAIGIDELRGMVGASPEYSARLRQLADVALRPAPQPGRHGMFGKLGPIFKRVPGTPVVSPTQPEPRDLDALLAGAYVPPERAGATWRLLEILTQGMAWGSTRMGLTTAELDDLDFALARGGVSAAVGLRHLLDCSPSLPLIPVQGLTVGWHPLDTALAMATAYRSALAEVKTDAQREMIEALARWLDGFAHWSRVAPSLSRPAPDLVAFWAH